MKRLALAVLLFSGSGAMAAHQDSMPPTNGRPSVTIVTEHGTAFPATYSLRAKTVGLKPPLRFHWSLGNGEVWNGPSPPAQNYDGGRYDVVVTVTDADGLVRKTSLTIEVEGEHQH
jgi:hypothetical protein